MVLEEYLGLVHGSVLLGRFGEKCALWLYRPEFAVAMQLEVTCAQVLTWLDLGCVSCATDQHLKSPSVSRPCLWAP